MQSHWSYKGVPFTDIPEKAYGFIYRITNLTSGKFYIGMKQFTSVTRKKVVGRKNRKVIRKEMKWREYTGSNVGLNEDIKLHGKEAFSFEVLALAKTKGQLTFLEVCAQIKFDVLFSNSYNDSIGSGKWMNMVMDDDLLKEMKGITDVHL